MSATIYTADEWNKSKKIDFEKIQAEKKKQAAADKAKREAADKKKGNYFPPSGSKAKETE
jgi:hypothetical protein